MYLTKRLVRYKQADGEIWLNTLTGAVDRLSDEEVSLVDRTPWPRKRRERTRRCLTAGVPRLPLS